MLPYRTYSVSLRDKEPLLRFLHDALSASGCRIIWSSSGNEAPFRISFETPTAERLGVIVYAFFANAKETRNRPNDEYRMQVKYGQKQLDNVHLLYQDPFRLYTTLLMGINPDEGFFVGFDPVLHSPTKHFISLEFKRRFVEQVQAMSWSATERDRKTSSDEPVEVIVGGTREQFLRYVLFEREALGEDQGHRELLAERHVLAGTPSAVGAAGIEPDPIYTHRLATEFDMSEAEVLDLISGASRLKMAVRGWVAEHHLVRRLASLPGVSDCFRLEGEGLADISLRYCGGPAITVECKNVLRRAASGAPQLDFQRTRSSIGDPCSRYYSPDDFDVVAACLHARTEIWEYAFALPGLFAPHKRCPHKLATRVSVEANWTSDPGSVLHQASDLARARV